MLFLIGKKSKSNCFRACSHGGGGGGRPWVGEVTCLKVGNPPVHIISYFILITFT